MMARHRLEPPTEWAFAWDHASVLVADSAVARGSDPNDSTWIYDQLGLSPDEYKDPAPDAANLPSSAELHRRAAALNLDYDALRPGDPTESVFPPGSLGAGGVDPPTRKWDGFGSTT